MGQHKHNPKALLAKEGMLPPKDIQMSKREAEYRLQWEIYKKLIVDSGLERVLDPDQLQYLKG